ncbi:GNAT family N-acetyltransferase [Mesorhizobium sp. SARCC-RB16n]|uniref:GNAT family N-acetyltransferase n=1 Tax=Mesorhizobium sp. SARCC-RB16n TaxID=2116687 RepID=UPI00122F29FE|nr:GNAT family N-acetyltransferase [Mesorhizobium sp. SARCC-RB16n]KAA3451337.1 GNAT family N-acetyltransferase [Mesorhizobium sp. SARCC-RB16n]
MSHFSRAVGWMRAAGAGLTFRPITDDDLPFLAGVYASTRAEELTLTSWTEAQKAAFLDMQFQAQHAHYRKYYPNADWLVTMHAGSDVGRLYIERWPGEHRIIDITFLPAFRGKGLGSALLADLIDEAGAVGKAVSIHVEKHNPAMRLYLRLGFTVAEDKGVYDLMVRPASSF